MHARGDEVLQAHVEDPPPSVNERRGDLSPAIDSVVARGTAKDPDDRYGSCTGLIAAARTALARAPRRGRPSAADTPASAADTPASDADTPASAADTPASNPVRLR